MYSNKSANLEWRMIYVHLMNPNSTNLTIEEGFRVMNYSTIICLLTK